VTYRLPATILAPTLALAATVGFLVGTRHRDVAALAAAPLPTASVEAAFGPSHEKPAEGQLVTLDDSLDAGTPPSRVRSRLRSGSRPAALDGDPGATGVWASPAIAGGADDPPGALPSLRRAAFAGRCSSPSTAPPLRSL